MKQVVCHFLGKIDAPKNDYKSLKEVFETTLEHEKFITSKINELVEVTLQTKTILLLTSYNGTLQKQHEEEKLFNSIIDKFNLVGEDGRSLYFIDRDLATL